MSAGTTAAASKALTSTAPKLPVPGEVEVNPGAASIAEEAGAAREAEAASSGARVAEEAGGVAGTKNIGGNTYELKKAQQDAEMNKKTIDDILREAKPGRKTKGKTSQYIKSGSFKQTNEDFELLNPVDIKEINTNYGLGKTGRLSDGRFITARPGSSDGRPTLEIRAANGRGIELRYGE